jgi:hypothetical protein
VAVFRTLRSALLLEVHQEGAAGGAGGVGGGGTGGKAGPDVAGTAGTANLGGGGGAGVGTTITGKAGGSGVVIIDAGITAASTTGSPTLVGSVYTFTGSGTITF